MSPARRRLGSVAWLVGLAALLWWAALLPLGPAGTPNVVDVGALVGWLPSADAAVVVAGILRLVVVAVAAWMLVTSSVAMAAGLLGRQSLRRAVLGISPAIVRRVVRSTAAVTITATTLTVSPAGAAVPTPERPPVELSQLADDPASTAPLATLRLLPGPSDPSAPRYPPIEPATLALLPPADDTSPVPDDVPATVALLPPPDDTSPVPDEVPAAAEPTTWEVRPGDSFWRIAEEVLGRGQATSGDDAFIDYWRRLIDANRAELVDGDNPDLLLPGQVLTLP